MRWSEIALQQPNLAELGRQRLLAPGVVLVATIRPDGTPRLSVVQPLALDGALWLSMMWGSKEAADLLRDPRILVHSVITNSDGSEGEYKIRGSARGEDDAEVQRRYAKVVARALGWHRAQGRFRLFEVVIDHVAFIRYDPVTEHQHVAMWPPAREFIRRHATPTSLQAPEAAADILVSR